MTAIRTITLLAAVAYFASAAGAQTPTVPDAIKSKVQLCQSCHGADGKATDPQYPHLAGQYRDYLSRALHEYKTGERKNPVMAAFANTLSDDDIAQLAVYYADLPGKLDDLAKYEQGN
jgi:cytochrome c553